jgi:hypothetical protein
MNAVKTKTALSETSVPTQDVHLLVLLMLTVARVNFAMEILARVLQ